MVNVFVFFTLFMRLQLLFKIKSFFIWGTNVTNWRHFFQCIKLYLKKILKLKKMCIKIKEIFVMLFNNSIFSSSVFNCFISVSSWSTILGCGKKVSTKLSQFKSCAFFVICSNIFWWPKCTPSKVPMVTIVGLAEANDFMEWNIFKK